MFEGIAINFISAVLGAAILVFVNRAGNPVVSAYGLSQAATARHVALQVRFESVV